MNIKQINIFTYHLPLRKPIRVSDQVIHHRTGAIIRMTDDNNNHGYGETAPLPGLHRETMGDALKQLTTIQTKLTGAIVPNIPGVSDFLDTLIAKEKWYPSVRFGVESVLMNVYFLQGVLSKRKMYLPQNHKKIMINALADGNDLVVMKTVKRAIEEGYRSIKLKIGRRTIEEDIGLVKSVDKIISKKADLRLDANQAWDLPTAIHFAQAIQDCVIEYIEEPLQDPGHLAMLYDQTGIPIAVDESITRHPLSAFQVKNWMKALVLKPAVIGSVQDTLKYIQIARQSNLKIVFSDTFHSGVGLSFLIRLAASLPEMVPMGFDTYRWLAEDILSARLSVTNGSFDWQNVQQCMQRINFSYLQELSGSLSIDA